MPKIRHIEDYETRIKQLTDSQLLWDSDVQRLRDAKAAVESFQSRCFELEGMLRARDRVCREQADRIRHLENRVVIASSTAGTPANERAEKPERQPQTMDREFCMHVAENARRKAEKLERENLELTVELERLKRMALQSAAESPGGADEEPREGKGGARQLLGDLLSS